MPISVEVRELPSYVVASVGEYIGADQNITDRSRKIGDALLKWAHASNLKRDREKSAKGLAILNGDWGTYFAEGAQPEKHIPVFFVQGLPIGNAEAVNSIAPHLTKHGAAEIGLGIQHTPGGTYAVTRHQGPYTSERPSISALVNEWLKPSSYKYRGGPLIELYLKTIDEVHDEKELVTDICIPVVKK
jgi:DNA gyrase inhibitor GyrI